LRSRAESGHGAHQGHTLQDRHAKEGEECCQGCQQGSQGGQWAHPLGKDQDALQACIHKVHGTGQEEPPSEAQAKVHVFMLVVTTTMLETDSVDDMSSACLYVYGYDDDASN